MKVSTSCKAIICLLVAIVPGTLSQDGCPPLGDTTSNVGYLLHETDCTKFYQCVHGNPVLMNCPAGLHFNIKLNICDWPEQAGCADRTKCLPLSNGAGSVWSPASCTQRNGKLDEYCTIQCAAGYEHKGGNHVQCKPEGWQGPFFPESPECFKIEDLVDEIVDVINETLAGRDANFLFILDESGSVAPHEFALEISFMKSLVGGFPLSVHRSAGIITFSHHADVDVPLKEENTCLFMRSANQIVYTAGGTDIYTALALGLQEIHANAVHPLTLVFLVTDGESFGADPSISADALKANPNNILFALGVAGYKPTQLIPLASLDKDSKPLFYGIDSFEIFKKVADYLDDKYSPNSIVCP